MNARQPDYEEREQLGSKELLLTGDRRRRGADCEVDGGVRDVGVHGAGRDDRRLLPAGDTGRLGVSQAEGDGGGHFAGGVQGRGDRPAEAGVISGAINCGTRLPMLTARRILADSLGASL